MEPATPLGSCAGHLAMLVARATQSNDSRTEYPRGMSLLGALFRLPIYAQVWSGCAMFAASSADGGYSAVIGPSNPRPQMVAPLAHLVQASSTTVPRRDPSRAMPVSARRRGGLRALLQGRATDNGVKANRGASVTLKHEQTP